jgi:hypothetical protein
MNIKEALKEIRQNRSSYQLEKFVIGQHHSPEMQYNQLVIEASGLIDTIKETELRIKKIQAECEELRETGKKSDAIEADIKELAIEGLELHLIGSQRELNHLQMLFDEFPKFTREEIEAAQQDYWETRLTRVAQLQMLSRQGGVDWAQLEAIYQVGVLPNALEAIPTMNQLMAPKIDYIQQPVKKKLRRGKK